MTIEARNALAVANLDLVRAIAWGLRRRLPPWFELDDLISSGCIGLLESIETHDPSRSSLRTHCGRRVYGAMLDYLREWDHLSRRSRQQGVAVSLVQMRRRRCAPADHTIADREAVGDFCRGLTRRSTLIVKLHLAGFLMREIGAVVGCTESWACMLFERIKAGRC